MKKAKIFFVISMYFLSVLTSLYAEDKGKNAKSYGYPVETEWKYHIGNKSEWISPDFNYKTWDSTKMPCIVSMKGEKYIVFKTNVKIPKELSGEHVYLDTGHAYAAFDVYADGIFIGSNGRLPPDVNVRPKENSVLLIPENLLTDNELALTFVYWTNADVLEILEKPVFMNRQQTKRIIIWRQALSNTMYVIIAVLCLAMGVYMITQYLMNRVKGKTFLWFALSSLTVSLYFYDMGCEQIFFSFILQREISRSLLNVSMGFLLMFFHQFLSGHLSKKTIFTVVAVDAASILGHLTLMGNWVVVSNFFTVSLIPVVYVCIYGIVVSIKGLKEKSRNMTIVLIGFLLAVGLAFVDILAQVQGKNPFVWLQGYAFFILNLSVFLTLSVDSVKNQKAVDRLVDQGNEHNLALAGIFEQASALTMSTTEIAGNLNRSVQKVSDISKTSMDSVHGIEKALFEQEDTMKAADIAVDKLIQSLSKTNENLEKEAESIAFSAEQTAKLMEGFQSVGTSISGAADLAQSLDELTVKNSQEVNMLSEAMEEMKNRSDEIITIVQVLDNFSKRTNLLAMNASIEAAHAGIAGKGFAVVANEIKNLAAQSSAQAQKISENIDEISQSIESGVKLAEGVQKTLAEMRREANDTANHVRSAADEMNRQQGEGERIELEARKISEAADQMKKAAFEQFNYSDTVKLSMEKLRSATKAVDEAVGAISDASRNLWENVADLKNMSEKTSETSDRLSQMMML